MILFENDWHKLVCIIYVFFYSLILKSNYFVICEILIMSFTFSLSVEPTKLRLTKRAIRNASRCSLALWCVGCSSYDHQPSAYSAFGFELCAAQAYGEIIAHSSKLKLAHLIPASERKEHIMDSKVETYNSCM